MEFEDWYKSVLRYLEENPGDTVLDYDTAPGPRINFILLDSKQTWFISESEFAQFVNQLKDWFLKKKFLSGDISVATALNNQVPYEELEDWYLRNKP